MSSEHKTLLLQLPAEQIFQPALPRPTSPAVKTVGAALRIGFEDSNSNSKEILGSYDKGSSEISLYLNLHKDSSRDFPEPFPGGDDGKKMGHTPSLLAMKP